jgi:fused signal recognition particle receptor
VLSFFKKGLSKTVDAIKDIGVSADDKVSKDALEDLLLEADVTYELVEELLEDLPSNVTRDKLENKLLSCFTEQEDSVQTDIKPFVEIIIGVNGAGKTTTISKLASKYKADGSKVILGASDTFRAAAIEQLSRWATKIGVDIVSTAQGHDPSAVAFDTISKAVAKAYDRVIIDTAGRLHTQTNLASELQKIMRVSAKALPEAPHRKILILDGTQGNSAISQAHAFHEMVGLDGIIVTKLDGTARGGAIFSIAKEMQLPILYVGVGETPDDLVAFNAQEFVTALLDGIYN